jgi:hypothetical protein
MGDHTMKDHLEDLHTIVSRIRDYTSCYVENEDTAADICNCLDYCREIICKCLAEAPSMVDLPRNLSRK